MDCKMIALVAYPIIGVFFGIALVKIGPEKTEEVSYSEAWGAIIFSIVAWPLFVVFVGLGCFSDWLVKPDWR